MTDEPTREDLLAVCSFARRFEEPGFVAGEWLSPEPMSDGTIAIGYWAPSEDVASWVAALNEHHIVISFDWTDTSWGRQMRRYYADPTLLDRADLLTIRKVLTTLLRAERFSEGTLADAFDHGVAQTAMERLKEIATQIASRGPVCACCCAPEEHQARAKP